MLTKLYVRAQTMFVRDDEGATATEYGVLVAVIAFILIVGALAFGGALRDYFNRLAAVIGGWQPAGAITP